MKDGDVAQHGISMLERGKLSESSGSLLEVGDISSY